MRYAVAVQLLEILRVPIVANVQPGHDLQTHGDAHNIADLVSIFNYLHRHRGAYLVHAIPHLGRILWSRAMDHARIGTVPVATTR